jgi:hypothetical protein
MIFASNKPAPVEIAPDDRRFNVGAYQDSRLTLTNQEIFDLIPAEIPAFYSYLMQYPADTDLARTPLVSAARAQMIEVSTNAIDLVSQAVLAGDIDFFWDQLKDRKPVNNHLVLGSPEGRAYEAYRDLVVDIAQNQPASLSREELRVLYEWTVGNMPVQGHKFTSMVKHHKIQMTTVWRHGRSIRGISTSWRTSPRHAAMLAEIAAGSV